MSNKALITRRTGATSEPATAAVLSAEQGRGVVPEADTPAGVLVRGTDRQFEALEAAGYRVKLLPDTNLLRIGRYTIDVETKAEPDIPRDLDVSAAELPGWPHHLVQLAGPPLDTWVRAIEARGLDVVEPVSGYGLFVSAPTAAVAALRDLAFVVWIGPLKPAYRISSHAAANVEYVSVGVYPSSEAAPSARRSKPREDAFSKRHASPPFTAVSTRSSECKALRSRPLLACRMFDG